MGSYVSITGRVYTRKGYSHLYVALNAGVLSSGKRNRIEVSTPYPVRGNVRSANAFMNDMIQSLEQLRKQTGVGELKTLYKLWQSNELFELGQSIEQSNDNPLCSTVIDEWLAYDASLVSPNLALKHKYAANHIKTYLDDRFVRIKELDAEHIAQYYVVKKKGNPDKKVKPLSARYSKRSQGGIYRLYPVCDRHQEGN